MNENNYGFAFNNITIDNNSFIKSSKNVFGKLKINNEIDFYLFIIQNNVKFPIPDLINYGDGCLTLQYIHNSTTLEKIIDLSNIHKFINTIKIHLSSIHAIKKQISTETLQNFYPKLYVSTFFISFNFIFSFIQ